MKDLVPHIIISDEDDENDGASSGTTRAWRLGGVIGACDWTAVIT